MPFPDCVPELTDGRVRLRAHRASDAERIVEQSNDPQSLRWTTVPAPYGPEQARSFLQLIETAWNTVGADRYWAICAADDPAATYQGTIDLRARGGGLAAVGYGLHPDGRGQHLMSGALRLVADYWFARAGGTRLTWTAFGGNLASWAVARAAGFRFDAVLPRVAALRTGEIGDEWIGSLDAGDGPAPKAPWFVPPRMSSLGIGLRPWRDDDVGAVEDSDIPGHWVPAAAVPTPGNFSNWLGRRRRVMATGTSVNWCIADTATDRAMGEVMVFDRTNRSLAAADTAELGYLLFASARGRGVATIACRMAVAHAFAPAEAGGLGLRRLVAETAADNAASNRVLESLGFCVWGREEAATAPDGTVGSAWHWSLNAPADTSVAPGSAGRPVAATS